MLKHDGNPSESDNAEVLKLVYMQLDYEKGKITAEEGQAQYEKVLSLGYRLPTDEEIASDKAKSAELYRTTGKPF